MSILIFILVLVVLIIVHEFGHFIVAKLFGIRVDEFGLGFPPKLFGKKFGETEYTFNAIPAGGFVRIYGEDAESDEGGAMTNERSFVRKPKLVQIAVLAAGVGFNILFAWLLFSGSAFFGIPSEIEESEVAAGNTNTKLLVLQVFPDTPAAEGGIPSGAELLSLSTPDARVDAPLTPSRVTEFISARGGEDITATIATRHGETNVVFTPKRGILPDEPERAAAGFTMALAGEKAYPLHLALLKGAEMTGSMLVGISVGLAHFFYQVFLFQADFASVAGPVGIVGMVGDASALGFLYLINFAAFISLNLAVINLLPFPALDGGRVLFVLIEAIKGSPIRPSVAAAANRIGFAILILLMIAVTYNDIVKII